VSAVLLLLSDSVEYENAAFLPNRSLRGRAAVGRFYVESLAGMPEGARFVLDSWTRREAGMSGSGSSAPNSPAGAAGTSVEPLTVRW
jgi:hypothetical protein